MNKSFFFFAVEIDVTDGIFHLLQHALQTYVTKNFRSCKCKKNDVQVSHVPVSRCVRSEARVFK